MSEGKETSKSQKSDITFFHPDLLKIPENGELPYLQGHRCKACGNLDFPKPTICLSCWGEVFEIVPLSRKGVLYSFSDVFIGQPGMRTPYTFGYVDLPENLRILAQLEGAPGSFKCDDQMELTVGPIRMNRDGLPITSYLFRKAVNP